MVHGKREKIEKHIGKLNQTRLLHMIYQIHKVYIICKRLVYCARRTGLIQMTDKTEYHTKVKGMTNKELDIEFKRVNKLRNETDNDYTIELNVLNMESAWREYELPNEITKEILNLQANEFCGVVNWSEYNYVHKSLGINYRLEGVIYRYWNVPRSEYQKFKLALVQGTLEAEEKYMAEFKRKYKGEVI